MTRIRLLVLCALAVMLGSCATSQFPYQDPSSTHVIASETPYYTSSPAQGRPADGTLKLGLEVSLLRSEGSYSLIRYRDGEGNPQEVFVDSQALLRLNR